MDVVVTSLLQEVKRRRRRRRVIEVYTWRMYRGRVWWLVVDMWVV